MPEFPQHVRTPSKVLEAGVSLGPYVLGMKLGEGGMGMVFDAVHRTLEKNVAIKSMLLNGTVSTDAVERFVREGKAASKIRHPHVVDVTDIGTDSGILYMVMERLEGEDLRSLNLRKHPLGVDETLDIMIPVISGVAAAHDLAILHRDLKPANIFLTTDPRTRRVHPKVLDFGIAKMLTNKQATLTQTSAVMGTPLYLPPEQVRCGHADHRGDQYSAGVIAYECLAGGSPFREEGTVFSIFEAITQGEYDSIRARNPAIPEELEAIVMRAMSIDPEDRFSTMRHFGRALLPFASAHTQSLFQAELTQESVLPPAISTPRLVASPRTVRLDANSNTRNEVLPIDAREPTAHVKTRRSKGWILIGLGALIPIAGVLLVSWLPTDPPETPVANASPAATTFAVALSVIPAHARITIDGEEVGQGAFVGTYPIDGQTHTLIVAADGCLEQTHSFRDGYSLPRIELQAIPTVADSVDPSVADETENAEPEPAEEPTSASLPQPSSSPSRSRSVRSESRRESVVPGLPAQRTGDWARPTSTSTHHSPEQGPNRAYIID